MGPTGTYDHTDAAVRAGVIAVTVNSTNNTIAGVHVSTDGGATWARRSQTETSDFRAVVALPTGWLAQASGRYAYRSSDGATWTQIVTPQDPNNITRYYHDASTDRLYAATQRGPLLRSTNAGATWSVLAVPAQDLTHVSARGATILTGYNGTFGGAYLSTDDGATWTNLATRGLTNATASSASAVTPDGTLYVVAGHLYRSRDGGASWTNLTTGLTPTPTGAPILLPSVVYVEGERILFSSNRSAYVSLDDGATWTLRTDGFPATGSGALTAFFVHDGHAYVLNQQFVGGTASGYGLYRRPLAELGLSGTPTSASPVGRPSADVLTVGAASSRGPVEATLAVATGGPVHLAVYDALGRRVAVLHDGPLSPGTHRFAWTDVAAAGVYVVRARTSDGVHSRAVVRTR